MPKLTPEDVRHIAQLSNLTLTDEEIERLRKDLASALDYVEVLDSLDLKAFHETFQVTGLINVYRDLSLDKKSLPLDEVLKNAPHVAHNAFEVPSVLGRDT